MRRARATVLWLGWGASVALFRAHDRVPRTTGLRLSGALRSVLPGVRPAWASVLLRGMRERFDMQHFGAVPDLPVTRSGHHERNGGAYFETIRRLVLPSRIHRSGLRRPNEQSRRSRRCI